MKVEVAVLGSPFPTVLTVSVDVKQRLKKPRTRVRVEVDVLGSPSLKVLYMASVDVNNIELELVPGNLFSTVVSVGSFCGFVSYDS